MSEPATNQPPGRITSVLHEALDVLATPTVRDTTIQRALAVAGYDVIPESGPDVRRFVDEFLRVAVVSTLGEDAADHVCTSLEPIVRMAETQFTISEVRTKAPEAQETQEAPAEPAPTAPIVVCSPLSFVAKALGKAIGDSAEIKHASDEIGLIDILEDDEQTAPAVVVVDCRTAAIDVATLATIIAEQTPIPLLVLWGATEEIQEEVSLAAEEVRSVPVPGDCDVHELATRCTLEN